MNVMEWFKEQFYILFSMYYYEVFLYKGNIQVGRFIQAVSFNALFVVDFSRELAWPVIRDTAFVKGHKLILHYDIDRALPLTKSVSVKTIEINNSLVRTKKEIKLVGKITEKDKENANGIKLTELNLPPRLIFEMFNAHFVVKTLTPAKSTNWFYVILVIVIAVVVLLLPVIFIYGLK